MSQPLFDDMQDVGERIRHSPPIILCLDYDRSLATIAPEPTFANLSPHMRRALLSLATHPGITLAVISGRDRTDLQSRVNIPGVIYAGNHGLEISGPGFLFV